MNINNNYSFAENQADSPLNQDLIETGVLLTQDELSTVGGGMMYLGLSWFGVAFAAGYGIGTAIDKTLIAPLWK